MSACACPCNEYHFSWDIYYYKYKNNWIKLKDEVGMVGSKRTQTRFVGIITFIIHPYACFSRLSCAYWCRLVCAILQWVFSTCMREKISPMAQDNFDSLLHPMHIDTQKASVGMYTECDYPYKSCLCTFWPCYPYFILQFYSVFYTCFCFFYCSQNNSSFIICCQYSSVEWRSYLRKILSHAPR